MVDNKLATWFEKCDINPPAGQTIINRVRVWQGKLLPENYLELLNFSNGIEGEIKNGSWVQFWKAEELEEFNRGYQAAQFVPEMLLIGSNGGDEAIGIDMRGASPTEGCFFRVPFIPLGWNEAKLLGKNIDDISFA